MTLHTVTNGQVSDASDANQFYTLLTGGDTVAVTIGDASTSANRGTLSVGTGPWDGSSTGHFVGSSSGTALAANAASGYSGNLLDLQVQGTSELSVTAGGMLKASGGLTARQNSQIQIGDGSNNSAPEWHWFGTNGAWGIGIDSAAAIPYRDFAIFKYTINRTVTDGVTTNGSATVTSATASFVSPGDVGRLIYGQGIPQGTTISSVTNSTTAVLSANATATGSSLYFAIGAAGVSDVLYISGNGSQPVSFGLGVAQPSESFRVQMEIDSNDLTQGTLWLQTVGSQTGDYFRVASTATGTAQVCISSDYSMLVASSAANRTFTDGGTTNTSATLTSTSAANFTAKDVGRYVTGTGIPAGTYIASVQSTTSATMSKNATATNSGLSITIYQGSFVVQTNGGAPMMQMIGAAATPTLVFPGFISGGAGAIPNPTYAFDFRSTGTTDMSAFFGTPSWGSLLLTARGNAAEGQIGTTNASKLSFRTGAVTYAQLGTDGAFSIGGVIQQGSGSGPMLYIANDISDPSANPTSGGILYVASGALKYRGSSGTVTTIANA